MAIDPAFDEELADVDATKSFLTTINGAWGENEWEVAGYSITAGSDEAAEHGASAALHELGYRFWAPDETWTVRPGSLPAGGVTLARQEFALPYCRMFNTYGFDGQDARGGTALFNRWSTLNAVTDVRRPNGHGWDDWFADDRAWFDANPSYWSWRVQDVVPLYDIENHGEALAQRAAYWLSGGVSGAKLNAYNRRNWDPFDGNTQASSVVWPWAARVVEILRTTYAITYAELGVLCYPSHDDPLDPQTYDLTGLYGQVALGFSAKANELGGYTNFVEAWGEVLPSMGLYAYGDIPNQGDFRLPFKMGSTFAFANDYPSFIASGVIDCTLETNSNFWKSAPVHHMMHRIWKTGGNSETLFATAVNEIVSGLFGNDGAVGDFYQYLADNANQIGNMFSLKRAWDIVDAMQTGWHKDLFQAHMCIATKFQDMADNLDYDGPYFTKLEQAMRWSEGVYQADGVLHRYGISGAIAGAGVTTTYNRQDLYYLSNPRPHWHRHSSEPTADDINAARSLATKQFDVPAICDPPADISDWVEVTPPAPIGAADVATADATLFRLDTACPAIFSGPGSVTFSDDAAATLNVQTTNFGAGLTAFTAERYVTWSGGTPYLIATPQCDFEYVEDQAMVWWVYLPETLRGRDKISARTRLSVIDRDGYKGVKWRGYEAGEFVPPETIQPGLIVLENSTRGYFTLAGANPCISPDRTKMLMPLALAQREGLA